MTYPLACWPKRLYSPYRATPCGMRKTKWASEATSRSAHMTTIDAHEVPLEVSLEVSSFKVIQIPAPCTYSTSGWDLSACSDLPLEASSDNSPALLASKTSQLIAGCKCGRARATRVVALATTSLVAMAATSPVARCVHCRTVSPSSPACF